MKEEKIKVLALLPMELPKEIELDNTLEAMQKFVGGLIECITLTLDYPYVHHSIKHYFQAIENPHGTSSMWAFSCYHPTDFRWDSCTIYSCTALLGIFQDRPILMAFIFPDFKSL